MVSIQEAYARCTKLATEHYENFPVGRLVPAQVRPHIHAVYAFARVADDLADEGFSNAFPEHKGQHELSREERVVKLDEFEQQLTHCLNDQPILPQYDWIFVALKQTIKENNLPPQLCYDLLSAFRQDIVKDRYQNFDEVLDYCKRSANPIGRLVLLLHGYREEKLHILSDHICTALQLANFWQDVSVDLYKDRIYIPMDDQKSFGFDESLLFKREATPDFRSCLKYQVYRTQNIFDEGKALCSFLSPKLAWEIRLTWLGGTTILEKIREQNYDTLTKRPKLNKWDILKLLPYAWFTKS
jgi:squalene synthase HpnC